MKNTIEVNGIQLYAYHGCLLEESKIGGHYTVDISLTTDFSESFKTDELADTIDYVTVNKIVEEEMAIRSKLIEHVGYRIVEKLKNSFKNLEECIVKVTKHAPPIGGNVKNVVIIIKD